MVVGNDGRPGGPPLCSRLKYLNNYWIDCNEIMFGHSGTPRDESYPFCDPHTFLLGATSRSMFPSYTVKYSISIPAGRIDTNVCSDTHGPFSPLLTFPPPSP